MVQGKWVQPGDEMSSSAGFAIAGAAAAGFGGGMAFFAIWRKAVPGAFMRRFWTAVPGDVQGMLKSQDPDVMLAHYKALLVSLGGFAARNLLGLVLGIAPMALAYGALHMLGALGPVRNEVVFAAAAVAGSVAAALAAKRRRGARA